MQEIKTVMLLGATGNLGPHILSALLAADFSVTVLSRNRTEAAAKLPTDVPILESDYSFASLVEAFKGQDAVVSTLATLSVQQQLGIIDAAVAAGVKRFLPSEFGSDTSVNDEVDVAQFLSDKQEVVKYLRTKEANGLSWTALCTGPWIDWMLEEGKGLLGIDIRSKSATIIGSGNEAFTTSTISLVGKATASVLRHPEETKNEYVQVHSFTLTQNGILQALERLIGVKFSTTRMSAEELVARTAKRSNKNEGGDEGDGHYELVTATVYGGSKFVYFPERAERWNRMLDLVEEHDLDGMIQGVLAKV